MTMQHTPGPWKLWNGYGPLGDGKMRVARLGNDDGHGMWASEGRDIVGNRDDLELLTLAPTAPHECSPDCPGEQNRRKLEAFDTLLEACNALCNAGKTQAVYFVRDIGVALELAQVAVAKAEGRIL